MKTQLEALQKKIYEQQVLTARQYNPDFDTNDTSEFDRFTFLEQAEMYHIFYYGIGIDEKLHMPDNFEDYDALFEAQSEDFNYENSAFADLLAVLIQHPEKILSLNFDGPDQGANGTKEWDFNRVVNSGVVFQNLRAFKVQLNDVGNHNGILMGMHHDPNPQQVSQLLLQMPNVECIEIPAVPDAAFLQGSFPNLYFLRVQANYDHFNFISQLANSALLKQIVLDYTDCLHIFDNEAESAQIEAIARQEAETLAKKMAEGFTKEEAEKELLAKDFRDYGMSEDEIQLMVYDHTREETLRLLKLINPNDAEAVELDMADYESMNKWDADGNIIPENLETFAQFEETALEYSDTANKTTPFSDYLALVTATKNNNFSFHLRENALTEAQRFQLQKANPKMQFLHIPMVWGTYVNHQMKGL